MGGVLIPRDSPKRGNWPGLVAFLVDPEMYPRNAVDSKLLSFGSVFQTANAIVPRLDKQALLINGTSYGQNASLTLPTSGLSTRSFTFVGRLRTLASDGVGVGARDNGSNILLWRNGGQFDMRVGGRDYNAAGAFALNTPYDYAITSDATSAKLYVDGSVLINGGVAGSGTLANLIIGRDPQGGGGQDVEFEWFAVLNRGLQQVDLRRLWADPRGELLGQPTGHIYVDFGSGTAHNLVGSNCSQSAISGTGTVSQTHALEGLNCSQLAISGTGTVGQTHALGGSNCSQSAVSGAGEVQSGATQHDLIGSNCTAAATSSAAVVTQAHALTGDGCSQSATSGTGAVTQAHTLVCPPSVQDSVADASAVVQTHILIGGNCDQANTSDYYQEPDLSSPLFVEALQVMSRLGCN